jgi:hypothetical protein
MERRETEQKKKKQIKKRGEGDKKLKRGSN